MNFWAIEPPADPIFDPGLGAWIVTRYQDVAAALREPRLIPALARSDSPAVPIDRAVHAEFRTSASRALSVASIERWSTDFNLTASSAANALPDGEQLDLMDAYAGPLSMAMARIACDVPVADGKRLASLSRVVFDSACEPFDAALAAASRNATVELANYFRDAPPWTVQMFIALAHSLPAFLGNAWLALLDFPVAMVDLSKAMDELLRFAGPAKAQFRQAVDTVEMGTSIIAKGQRAILRLDVANRDPDEFPEPDELRFDRSSPAHLAFGGGLHACVGATLVKSAATAATKALFDRFELTHHHGKAEDHFAVRYVSSLVVTLSVRRGAIS